MNHHNATATQSCLITVFPVRVRGCTGFPGEIVFNSTRLCVIQKAIDLPFLTYTCHTIHWSEVIEKPGAKKKAVFVRGSFSNVTFHHDESLVLLHDFCLGFRALGFDDFNVMTVTLKSSTHTAAQHMQQCKKILSRRFWHKAVKSDF